MLQIAAGAIMLGLLWALMTLGVYITYRILNIADLTVEGTIAMGAAIAARAISTGFNPYLATGLAIVGGAAAGLVTGLLHTRLQIPALLAGILTMIGLYSVNLRILGKANLSLLRLGTAYTPLQKLGLWKIKAFNKPGLSITLPVIAFALFCVFAVVMLLHWFFNTEAGYALRATGDNLCMSRAQGINTDTMIVLGLMLSNGLVAFSGALIAQQQAYADVQMGTGAIVIGLASVIIGEVLFPKRTILSRLVGLVLGAVTYRLIIALVLEMGMPAHDLKLFTALTVALALALPVFTPHLNFLKKSIGEVL